MYYLPISGINSKVLDTANEDNTSDSSSNREKLKYKTTLTHVTALGQANFDIEEESDGTKNLISFSFPWLLMDPKYGINSNAKSLEIETNILVVDELDSSLHPKIVETLIARFISKPNSAQLIFTTHDTHLMNAKLLRRDQYWLTERDENGATQLRSIHEFEGRESEDIEKRYYEGRYRSLPIIKRV